MTETACAGRPEGLAAYVAVTVAYWAFMLTDGALRMLVLLHFHTLGFSPIQLAYLFLVYEFMGMVGNLSAGWIGARFGLTSTLYAGLTLQIIALAALTGLSPDWALPASIMFVMSLQGASGFAKDLTKMSAKSAVKLLAPPVDGALFRWTALLTGSKNAVKGLGFLLGAALLALAGFKASLLAMAVVLAVILVAVALLMPAGLPRGRKSTRISEIISGNRQVNRLSAARFFLFGARDVWFVVGVPIYFYAVLSDGSEVANHTAFFQIGTFMALWVIFYGAIQANVPRLLGSAVKPLSEIVRLAATWSGLLTLVPFALAAASFLIGAPADWFTLTLVAGLMVFGAVFAINSAIHSYLILAFTEAERVTLDVGFYYMANAAGRFVGTLLSGLSYQIGGLPACLATAGAMAGLSFILARRLSG